MKLGPLSTKDVVSISPGESVGRALALMEEHSIHHLPVVEGGLVVGMLSDRDLLLVAAGQTDRRKAGGARGPGGLCVREIMSHPVHTLSPDDEIRSATWLMVTHRVHAIPLVARDRLAGLVTESDLLRRVAEAPDILPHHGRMFLGRLVGSYLHGTLITVGPRTSLDETVAIMCKKHIRHLPVVVGSHLVGIVSDRDVRRALGRAAAQDAQAQATGKFYLGPTEAGELMTADVQTILPSATTEAAIGQLLQHKIHCLPVVEGDRLWGVITDTDLLRALGVADKENAH